MNVLILSFSATGNTAAMARSIEEAFTNLGSSVTAESITSYKSRQKTIDLTPYDAVVFGAPVHARRAPRAFREWLNTLDGQGRKCSMFFTYGGFGVHPTHDSTRQILERQGFRVVSSAEFLGAHTFNLGGWKATEGRPDERDFAIATEYVERTHERFAGRDEDFLRDLPKSEYAEDLLDAAETSRFKVITQLPTRGGQSCSMCYLCEQICPTGAIEAESGDAVEGQCIACLACVANCLDNALKINDTSMSWPRKLEKENATPESLQAKCSRVYF